CRRADPARPGLRPAGTGRAGSRDRGRGCTRPGGRAMIGPAARARLTGLALYVLMAFILLFLRLLPVSPGAISWPGPNLLLALTLAWVLRRPDQVPALAIAL